MMEWQGPDYPPALNDKKTGIDLQKMGYRHWTSGPWKKENKQDDLYKCPWSLPEKCF